MLRIVAWALLALYLITIGLWSSAAAPVLLALAGLAYVLAAIPVPVLLLAAVVVWLKHRPTPKPATA